MGRFFATAFAKPLGRFAGGLCVLVDEGIETVKNFQTILSEIRTVAPVDCHVLIQAETGTGNKYLLA